MEKKEYKQTLNMPFTEFQMKADLPNKEVLYRQNWLDQKIYKKILAKNKVNQAFILHDGPPYANGSIHMGHALNKILKDIIVRYKSLQGFYSPFVAGWDTHGLPIENKMLNEMNLTSHKNISVSELRKSAAKYALEQIEIQKAEFKKLQLLSDLEDIYITMDPQFEAQQLRLFKKMALDGLIYKGLKPVYWSPSSQSALAEAEVEYADHTSPSIIVAFEVLEAKGPIKKGDNILIWTTTPWTLIANSGAAVGAEFEYVRVKVNDKFYVLATKLLAEVAKLAKWENYEIVTTFLGQEIAGTIYQRPIKTSKIAPVVVGHHVTLDSGTGIVHMAPLFGEDDFIIAKAHNLEEIMHVEDDGTLNEQGDQFAGKFYEDVNKDIGLFLESQNKLLSLKFIKHSYPHDWRTHKPIIYRGTPQWFVSIDNIRQRILEEIETVDFYADWAKKRLKLMIENRGDWTISRQRSWGVPIPVFYDENKKEVFNAEIFDHVIALVEKHGTDVWFNKTTDELLPEKFRNRGWTKENDIMDVWFDSGSSSIGVKVLGQVAPFDLYLEGSDQYRGWFNSSIINSVAYRDKSPYKKLLSHGFVVDEKGRKMSKSLGNGVDPAQVSEKLGADILRLWVSNSEYSSDVSISQNILNQNVEIYRKFRNTIKFLLGNLYDYKPNPDIKLDGVHLLIDEKIKKIKNKIVKYYDKFSFINVIKHLNNFIIDISNFYLSITKDSLYADAKDSHARLSVQYNLYNILDMLLISLAPILPTTTEEAYSFFHKTNKQESIHLENFFKFEEVNTNEEAKWTAFFELKDQVYKLIEEKIKAGEIKRSNEAKLILNTDNEFLKSLDLKYLLMVGAVEFGQKTQVEKFISEKCQRCWNHFKIEDLKDLLCGRCQNVL
ncbi:isoleucine--tRNA ligase [Mycoplasma iguanae]|uniref:Isoleucine--tRNA ligase n=1 Tax=Mycoplasma iguanae TaxID=292461 RepID=A0ABY5RA98_9MOLU|nr:isoleucine--tRNA ligase [Mycoplasma iguanae]UVD81540.1 isoleucine--tRNA ligase [Mycoplasma iguanae]